MTSPDPQSSRRNGLLPWILLAAVPLLISSCEQEPTTPPDPPLDPVSRVASLAWVVTSADPAELAATVEAVPTYTPTAVFLGGEQDAVQDL